jgi:hypothetical protein
MSGSAKSLELRRLRALLPPVPAGVTRMCVGDLVVTTEPDGGFSFAQLPECLVDHRELVLGDGGLGRVINPRHVGVLDRVFDGLLKLVERAGDAAFRRRCIRRERLLHSRMSGHVEDGRTGRLVEHHGIVPYLNCRTGLSEVQTYNESRAA